MHENRQGERLSSVAQNGVTFRKIKKFKCNGELFCAFSCDYWSCHMKWLHHINEFAKIFGHSSSLIIVRMMLMLNNIQEVKTMQSSNFDNYKEIREGPPVDDHWNQNYGKYTAKK